MGSEPGTNITRRHTYFDTLFQVESYFWGGGVEREARKDQKRLWRSKRNTGEEEASEKANSCGDCNLEDEILGEGNRKDAERAPLRVLDVGSCYNPFGELEGWQVKIMCIKVAQTIWNILYWPILLFMHDFRHCRFCQLTLPLPHLGESPIDTAVSRPSPFFRPI